MTDYPIPDPAWDYAAIYEELQAAIAEISKLETANPEADERLKNRMKNVIEIIEDDKNQNHL